MAIILWSLDHEVRNLHCKFKTSSLGIGTSLVWSDPECRELIQMVSDINPFNLSLHLEFSPSTICGREIVAVCFTCILVFYRWRLGILLRTRLWRVINASIIFFILFITIIGSLAKQYWIQKYSFKIKPVF